MSIEYIMSNDELATAIKEAYKMVASNGFNGLSLNIEEEQPDTLVRNFLTDHLRSLLEIQKFRANGMTEDGGRK
jgi:hypothetical protein